MSTKVIADYGTEEERVEAAFIHPPLAGPGKAKCRQESDNGDSCGLAKGHEGAHVAFGKSQGQPYRVWIEVDPDHSDCYEWFKAIVTDEFLDEGETHRPRDEFSNVDEDTEVNAAMHALTPVYDNEKGQVLCNAEDPDYGWVCTRHEGHEGNHVAHGGTKTLGVWFNDEGFDE